MCIIAHNKECVNKWLTLFFQNLWDYCLNEKHKDNS